MEGESDKELPESMDVDEAVAAMDEDSDLPDRAHLARPHEARETRAVQESDDSEDVPTEEAAPEFWSAEDKAAWNDVPAELRPLLRKYEQQRVEFVNQKAREAAEIREQARAEVERQAAIVDEAARWWAHAGPALQRAFADKWAQVNWNELAEKNPSEWAKLNQQRLDEAAMLAEAQRRGQADREAADKRAEQEFHRLRSAEHAKLTEKLPDFFGTPDAAHKTYDALGRFLSAKGIPAERINAIYEAPIIELALNAWRFEQAQQHALRSAERAKQGQSARPTPTRVAPGPSFARASEGNRQSDAARQVGERFRQSGGSSLNDAAELIRLSGL
jgi:hypothetical protein